MYNKLCILNAFGHKIEMQFHIYRFLCIIRRCMLLNMKVWYLGFVWNVFWLRLGEMDWFFWYFKNVIAQKQLKNTTNAVGGTSTWVPLPNPKEMKASLPKAQRNPLKCSFSRILCNFEDFVEQFILSLFMHYPMLYAFEYESMVFGLRLKCSW